MPLSKKQSRDFLTILECMHDERVRYFFMMLGDAIANGSPSLPIQANTGPAQLAEIEARLRAG